MCWPGLRCCVDDAARWCVPTGRQRALPDARAHGKRHTVRPVSRCTNLGACVLRARACVLRPRAAVYPPRVLSCRWARWCGCWATSSQTTSAARAFPTRCWRRCGATLRRQAPATAAARRCCRLRASAHTTRRQTTWLWRRWHGLGRWCQGRGRGSGWGHCLELLEHVPMPVPVRCWLASCTSPRPLPVSVNVSRTSSVSASRPASPPAAPSAAGGGGRGAGPGV